MQKCKESVMDMANEVTRVEAKLRVLQSEIFQLKEKQNNQPNKKLSFATDPHRLQDQIDYLCQRMNQNKSDLTTIQKLIHGQESKVILIDKQNYEDLKRDMKEMRAGIAALKGAQPLPPASTCSKLFPDVDLSTITPPEPSPTPQSSYFSTNIQPPIDPMISRTPTAEHTTPVKEQPLPYGQRLIVNSNDCAIECWICKCYRRFGQPNEYEAVTCGGDNIKFQRKDVIIDDFEPSHTTHVPHDYVITIMGGYDATPNVSSHAMKMEYPDDANDFSTASHNSYQRHHTQQQIFSTQHPAISSPCSQCIYIPIGWGTKDHSRRESWNSWKGIHGSSCST